jgi:hypothetical protein
MHLRVTGINFALFFQFSDWILELSDSVVFVYFHCILRWEGLEHDNKFISARLFYVFKIRHIFKYCHSCVSEFELLPNILSLV